MTILLTKDEVLDAVNELDGDGFSVHRCPGMDPPMSLRVIVRELRARHSEFTLITIEASQ
jgi:hypothetical protein